MSTINKPSRPVFTIEIQEEKKGIPRFNIDLLRTETQPLRKTSCTKEIAEACRDVFPAECMENQECMIALFFNRSGEIIGFMECSRGSIGNTTCDIRVIMQKTLLLNATGVVLCHNHPSGSLYPSNEDIEVTSRLKIASWYHGIKLMDHIILAKDGYCSMMERGAM